MNLNHSHGRTTEMQGLDRKDVLVLGCGNILFGDDGFGPAVADFIIDNFNIPDNVAVLNIGTSVRKLLFNILLSEKKPKKIIIVDAVDVGKEPGELMDLPIENIPANKRDDFSMHQMPSSNMLKELKELGGVDVRIIACQVERIPELVQPGLSDTLKNRIREVAERVMEEARR